jgi:selenocysteine lyase/cysteine desulfurase
MPKFDLQRFNYPVLERFVYFDTSTSAAIPQYACDAICSFYQRRTRFSTNMRACNEQWEFADELRDELAGMINAPGGANIAFGLNQSSLSQIFYNGVPLQPGDNVITYDTAYPSTTHPWLNKRERAGIEVRIARSEGGAVPARTLFDLADGRTRAISVCHVDNLTGYRHDLKSIGEFCRERKIPFSVDATQSISALNIDVRDMKIDFLAASGYKFLQNAFGLGFAYISDELMKTLPQNTIGWVSGRDRGRADNLKLDISPTASRFEEGGLNFMAMHGLLAVVKNYLRLGKADVQAHILGLTDYLYDSLKGVPEVAVFGNYPREHRSTIVMIQTPPAWQLNNDIMEAAGIRSHINPAGRLRVGIHYYNNRADVDYLVAYLKKCAAEHPGVGLDSQPAKGGYGY